MPKSDRKRARKKKSAGSRVTRKKSLRRRKEILGTVYELIAKYGIDGISMRRFAAAAGMSTGTINYHFGSKRNLLIAALRDAYNLPEDWENYSGSPLAQLGRLLKGYVFRSSHDRFWLFWIEFVAKSPRDSLMLKNFSERFAQQKKFWTKLIEDAIAQGEIKPNTQPKQAAEELMVIGHGLIVKQLADPSENARVEARREIDRILGAMKI